jgi:hypothetical protein
MSGAYEGLHRCALSALRLTSPPCTGVNRPQIEESSRHPLYRRHSMSARIFVSTLVLLAAQSVQLEGQSTLSTRTDTVPAAAPASLTAITPPSQPVTVPVPASASSTPIASDNARVEVGNVVVTTAAVREGISDATKNTPPTTPKDLAHAGLTDGYRIFSYSMSVDAAVKLGILARRRLKHWSARFRLRFHVVPSRHK